jgi:hypothetical protein
MTHEGEDEGPVQLLLTHIYEGFSEDLRFTQEDEYSPPRYKPLAMAALALPEPLGSVALGEAKGGADTAVAAASARSAR